MLFGVAGDEPGESVLEPCEMSAAITVVRVVRVASEVFFASSCPCEGKLHAGLVCEVKERTVRLLLFEKLPHVLLDPTFEVELGCCLLFLALIEQLNH